MNALHGLSIVLTRPAGQTALIAARIRAAGGEVLTLPLLDIIPPTEAVVPEVLQAQMARADEVVFISPNAVRMALQVLPAADWPPDCGLVAVGQGTARALREAGVARVRAPVDGADSEAVLAMPAFQHVEGRRVLLVRGEGGRELLAQSLSVRGAQVEHAVVYRRRARPPCVSSLRQHERLLFVVTSSEALRTLAGAAQSADDAAWLKRQTWVFAHPRIARLAETLGLNRGMIAPSPEDDAVFAALLACAPSLIS